MGVKCGRFLTNLPTQNRRSSPFPPSLVTRGWGNVTWYIHEKPAVLVCSFGVFFFFLEFFLGVGWGG